MKVGTRIRGWVAITVFICVASRPLAGAKYEAGEVKDGGTIVGAVRWEGEIPKRHRVDVSGDDQPCHAKPIPNEDLVVSKDGAVQWVVAYIKRIERGKQFHNDPDNPVTLDQQGCRFRPHVAVVPKGQRLQIVNSDGVLHNVHLYANKNEPFNRSMPGKLKQLDVTFDYPERIRVGCDVHQWMAAWIIVAEHPYFAVTGEDGAFRLENVPAGDYVVEIWHEKLGERQAEVTVKEGAEAKVDFVLGKKE